MNKGWLIYNEEDYKKNKVYAKMLIDYGKEQGLIIEILLREELAMGILQEGLVVYKQGSKLVKPEFVINRSRDYQLAKHLEYMGVQVFNSSQVSEIANDKGLTHQYINRLGISSMPTILYDKSYMKLEQVITTYPVVIKSVEGHGGEEVFRVNDLEEAHQIISQVKGSKLLIQEVCNQVGVDVRVFVIGGQIVGAIKRESHTDFRSNYSLGGNASEYKLNKEQIDLVNHILEVLPCDFVGIDFMINQEGKFIFNEIEDVVGSRTLYAYTQVDSAKLYIQHIKKVLQY